MAAWITQTGYVIAAVVHELTAGDASDAFGLVGPEVAERLVWCRAQLERALVSERGGD